MTINVLALCPEVVIQASDRRVSIAGVPKDALNKSLVFTSPRLHVGMTYTGLATTPDWLGMDLWVAEQIAKPDMANRTLPELGERVADRATDLFSRLPRGWGVPETIYTFAGWEFGEPRQVGVQVHNCLTSAGQPTLVSTSFGVRTLDSRRALLTAGRDGSIARPDRRRIERLISAGRSEESIRQAIVELMWQVAEREPNVVSSDFILMRLPREAQATSTYYQRGSEEIFYGPAVVTCDPFASGVHILGSPEVKFGDAAIAEMIFDKPPRPLKRPIR